MYYVHIDYFRASVNNSQGPQGDLITSRPEKDINEWLIKNHLRGLSKWKATALTGSNRPSDRGAMHTLHFEPTDKNPLTGNLVISFYEIVPVNNASEIL